SGTDWTWTAGGAVTFANASGRATWTVPRSTLGETDPCASAASLVFDIDDGNAPIMQQALTPASSCAAPAVSSPTVSAPGGAVTNGSAANDATTVQYSFSFTGAPKYFRVYVDTDASASTGFAAGGGVGAEYLIEGSGVYRSAGAGWNWTSVGNATFSSSGG